MRGRHRQILAYLAAPVLVGIAAVIRNGLLGPGGEPETDLLLLAVALAGFLGGLGPALVATAVGLSQEFYLHAGPLGSSAHRRDHVELGMFLASGVVIGVTFEVLRRVRRREAGGRRTLAMITRCNEAVLRATTEEELYADICRVIVDAGGYRMCWVGVPENDERRTLRPVAHAGHEDGYLRMAGIVWTDAPSGRGPAGVAIREGRIVVGRDFASEPALAPWKEEALRRGYRSVTALPLVHDGRIQAVIVMYAPVVAAFSRHELRFLKQLTKDVAFGVGAIRRREAQARQGLDLEVMADALKASEARLRSYFEASPLALFVGDSRGRFVDCNPVGLEMLGVDAATLRSMSIGDLVEAERRDAARQAYGTFVSTGKLDLEVRLVRPDGREVWVALRGVRIGDDRFMASVQDVTERRRAVEQLRESERWLRLSQDIARIGHYVLDVPGNHWTSSATLDAIFGVGEAFPRTIADWLRIVHPDDREGLESYLGDLLARGSRFDREYRVVDQGSREVKWVHGLGELERSPDGEPVRLVGTVQDVTARKDAEDGRRKLQAQLAHSARLAAMGTLVAGVAHEINNPLAALTVSAGVVTEDVREFQRILRGGGDLDPDRLTRRSGEVLEMLVEVGTSADRIARIVKDLTILGRPEQRRERIRLVDVVKGALAWLPPALAQRAAIRTEAGEVPDVMASAGQMEQVLVNLVANAALAFPEGHAGEIVIRLGPGSPGKVRVEVSDDGPGIPPELMERIFEPFFTTRPPGKGTGLGLSICNAIVGAHGGTIGVTSAPGKGSTFHLELPAAPAEG